MALFLLALAPSPAQAAPWELAPNSFYADAPPGFWSTKVELADLDGDGWVDVFFANVGGYQAGTSDSILANQAYRNLGGAGLLDVSASVFGSMPDDPNLPTVDTARVMKAADFDGDGDLDLIVGCTWSSHSRYYRNDGGWKLTELSESNLPDDTPSVGDLEVGDVDGDGDLDVVVTDWGPAPVGFVSSPGGITRLWLNDGDGVFEDVTSAQMPKIGVNWSWEHELLDVDNDFDLDLAISCRACASGGFFFVNDGAGVFVDSTKESLPNAVGAVDYEVMDIDGDGFVDLFTLQDGSGGGEGFRNRVLINDQIGGFDDATSIVFPDQENTPSFDYHAAFLDADSDGDPDVVLGAFADFDERLLLLKNGSYESTVDVWPPPVKTDGTYALAVADLNGDDRLDLVLAEGENTFRNRIFLGSGLAVDSAPPILGEPLYKGVMAPGENVAVHIRVHDNKSPSKEHDWEEVVVELAADVPTLDDADPSKIDLGWYGEYLWRGAFTLPDAEEVIHFRVCATDIAGNRACTEVTTIMVEPDPGTTSGAGTTGDMSTSGGDDTSAGTDGSATGGPAPQTTGGTDEPADSSSGDATEGGDSDGKPYPQGDDSATSGPGQDDPPEESCACRSGAPVRAPWLALGVLLFARGRRRRV